MKIAVDLTALAFNYSGIECYAFNTVKQLTRLDRSDDFVLVFANEVFGGLEEVCRQDNVQTVVLKSGRGKLARLLLFQVKLPSALSKISADLNIFPCFTPPLLWRRGICAVIHDMGFYDVPDTWKWYVSLYGRLGLAHAAKRAESIVTISNFSKSRIEEVLKPNVNIHVAYNAADSESFYIPSLGEVEKSGVREKYRLPSRYILCLSTLEPRKNLSLLINAYIQAIDFLPDDVHLVLAGRRGWKLDDLFSVLPNDIANRLTVTGFIDQADLPYVYAGADLFCFPSIYEGFGLPPLEALSCGCTVMLSDIPIFRELYEGVAIFFESDNELSLSESLIGFYSRERNDKSNSSLALEKYSWEKTASAFIDVFNESREMRQRAMMSWK